MQKLVVTDTVWGAMDADELLAFLRFLFEECGYRGLRLYDERRRWAGLRQFGHTVAIVTGRTGDRTGYDGRWCYHDTAAAKRALEAWDPDKGEPSGWFRSPGTGRRVAETEDEYDQDGKLVPIGETYVRW